MCRLPSVVSVWEETVNRLHLIPILFFASFLSFGDAALASDPLPYDEGLGFSFGNLGAGASSVSSIPLTISYRHWEGNLGWQAAGGVMYFPTPGYLPLLDYWIGMEGLWSLFSAQFSDWFFNQLFVFVDLTHHGYIPRYGIWSTADSAYLYTSGTYHAMLGLGAGVGIEFGLFQHFSTTFEAGYGAFWDPAAGTQIADQLCVTLIGQMTLHYRF
jgi:hypothetical protein